MLRLSQSSRNCKFAKQFSAHLKPFLNRFNFPTLRWLNTVLAVCDYMSFAKSWKEKGCCLQAETWQVKNVLMKDFE